jgi:hypothetical protein
VLNVNAEGVCLALDATNGAQQATLRLVLDMLLPNEAGKQAAAAIEECVLVGAACMSDCVLDILPTLMFDQQKLLASDEGRAGGCGR